MTTAGDALRVHKAQGADLAIVGLPLPNSRARPLLEQLRAQDSHLPIVVAGSDADVTSTVDAFDLGAHAYSKDPIADSKELMAALGLALGVRNGDAQLRYLRRKDADNSDWSALIGESPAMRGVVATLPQICRRMTGGAPILVTGETGPGKGLLAKSLHYNSPRRHGAFVPINCAAIPGQLLESELFGHEKGTFTDARSTRVGLFETADRGTLFLDEIGAMPLDLQIKILSAIEDREIRRVGGRSGIKVDVQIVAATHNALEAMVEAGSFRRDLYHRLHVITIELPPLRERDDDVIAIAEATIASLAAEYGIPAPQLAPDARAALKRYDWPGNVRELRNELERIILLGDNATIHASDLRIASQRAPLSSASIHKVEGGLQVVLSGESCPLDDLEREVIRQALVRYSGKVSRAARYLKITRQTLVYRMKKHGLASPSHPGDYSFTEDEADL